jgi:hypothetical protein
MLSPMITSMNGPRINDHNTQDHDELHELFHQFRH